MRKTKKLFLIAFAVMAITVLFCFNASALEKSGKCGDKVTWSYDSSTGTVTISGTGEMNNYNTFEEKNSPFTKIENNGEGKIEKVVIKKGVTSIGNCAFYKCINLKNITIPEGVTTIGYNAFYDCKTLANVTIPSSVTSLEYGAFSFCTALTSISIPEGVTSLGEEVFKNCTSLRSVEIPDSLTSIGGRAFLSCAALEGVKIPEKVTEIGDMAFSGCTALKSITVDKNNKEYTSVDGALFDKDKSTLYCYPTGSSNTSFTIPASVTYIYSDAISSGTALKSISVDKANKEFSSSDGVLFSKDKTTLIRYVANTGKSSYSVPEGVESIDEYAFADCNTIESITIAESVKYIGSDAFYNCDKLETVIFLGYVMSAMEYIIFDECDNLKSVIFAESVTDVDLSDFSLYKTLNCFVIYNPECELTDSRISKQSVIYGYKNSTAQEYADEYKLAFFEISEDITFAKSPAENHEHKEVALNSQIDETCAKNGITECKICSVCGVVTSAAEVIPAYEHEFEEAVPNCDFSYYPYDIKISTCIECGKEVSEIYKMEDMGIFHIDVKTTENSVKFIWGELDDVGGVKIYRYDNKSGKYSLVVNLSESEYGYSYTVKKLEAGKEYDFLVVSYGCWDWIGEEGESQENEISGVGRFKIKAVPDHTHSYKAVTKATLTKNGVHDGICVKCGYETNSKKIYYPKTIQLAETAYSYDGKAKKPSVVVKDSSGDKLTEGTDYTVTYPKTSVAMGEYTVTVKFKGNYTGTKKLTFSIGPAKTTISKLTAGSKQLTATWSAVNGANGYVIEYSTSKYFTTKTTKSVTVKNGKTTNATIKSLKSGKKYYVRIKAYKTVSGKNAFGVYSAVKNVKVK